LLQQTAKIELANQELETFSYSVSHDLRSPLRHIDGYIEILTSATTVGTEERGRYMSKISSAARQMGLLIDSLLAFSRMGRSAMNVALVDTEALVAQVREELALDMKDRIIEWKIGPLPKVHADQALFKQVWLNLLGNAIKYTRNRERAVIAIECREGPTEYEFEVKDNGAGFDMRYADKLFGIFQRLHFNEEFEGTGIGLANVKRIITRHDGRTWAQGELNVGATFSFTLPKTDLDK
jgi:chemotaxis family two-component system sensor kinase Cph1